LILSGFERAQVKIGGDFLASTGVINVGHFFVAEGKHENQMKTKGKKKQINKQMQVTMDQNEAKTPNVRRKKWPETGETQRTAMLIPLPRLLYNISQNI
jgi:hypothetical protein